MTGSKSTRMVTIEEKIENLELRQPPSDCGSLAASSIDQAPQPAPRKRKGEFPDS